MGDVTKSSYTRKKKKDDELFPYFVESYQTTILFTYYVVASIIVVLLAITLLWLPVCILLQELSVLVSRTILYTNKELLGTKNLKLFNNIVKIITSPFVVVTFAIVFFCCVIYLAAPDFLIFAGCYVSSWPDAPVIRNIKAFCLHVIDFLLKITGWKELAFVNNRLCLENRFGPNARYEQIKFEKADVCRKNKEKRKKKIKPKVRYKKSDTECNLVD